MSDFSGRVALVTGASRGLGRAVAAALATAGAHVVAVARSVADLETLDDEIQGAGGSATLVPLDLRDWAAIDRLGAAIAERWQRLDILVGNAAILGAITPVAHLDPELWHQVIGTNLSANWHLIRACDPLLRAAEAGRAVFITCRQPRQAQPFWGAYAASKAALETLALTYAEELRPTRARANLFDPGPMRTRLRAGAMPGAGPHDLPTPQSVVPEVLRLLSPEFVDTGILVSLGSRPSPDA
ncbi:MAG: SDR family NAD(P)-dependent oxidoreductase [Bauldia sp.]